MLRIGLTGGIGSGKSTVAQLFAGYGVTVIDADKIARDLTAQGTDCYRHIVAHFGACIVNQQGELDRRQLRQRIFSDEHEREWLERHLHPLIRQQLRAAMEQATGNYCIAVVPLLLENQLHGEFDRVLVVDSPTELQIQRTMIRDQSDATMIEKIMAQQMGRKQRLSFADDIIDNSTNTQDLAEKVAQLDQQYRQSVI